VKEAEQKMKPMTEIDVNTVRKDKQLPGNQNAGAVRIKEVPMRNLRVLALFVGVLLLATLPAAAAGRWRGGIAIVPTFRPWGWYGPFGYYGVYEPYGFYRPYTVYNGNTGEIKLNANVKNAEVYINGAFAGTADKLKSIRLRADAYNLELRAPGYASFSQKVFVVAGKTMRVHAELPAEARP
jgi:hypothetical protein